MRKRLLFAVALSGLAGVLRAASIGKATAEQTAPDTYVITFDAPATAFPVGILLLPRPGRFGEARELTRTAQPRVEVHLPAGSGQPFFRLQPADGEPVTLSIRRLPLQGTPNFRDLGGYRTVDGHRVRWGTVYRSGQLSTLTESDYKYLSTLDLKLVCDFRVDAERQRAPTKWQGEAAPEIVASPIDTVSYAGQSKGIQEHMRTVYSRMPFDGAAEYAALFRRIVEGKVPVLLHCTSGKDRTGFFSALLLTLLGVPRETVVEDFLLTNKYLVPDEHIPELARQMQERQKLAALPDAETVRAASGVLPSNLEIGFRVINEKYGSIDNYARQALQLSDDDRKALRARLLE